MILLDIFVIVCLINPRSVAKDSKSIMAYEDDIYKSVWEQKIWADVAGKEIKYITTHMPNLHLMGQGIKIVASTTKAKKALCYLEFRLFRQYLRNDHTSCSVIHRTAGTNFSVKQRLACFYVFM